MADSLDLKLDPVEKAESDKEIAPISIATVPDLKVYGEGDPFLLLSKASSITEGWTKATRALYIQDVGCLVEVTFEHWNEYTITNTFVPGVRIEVTNGDPKNGRKLVKI